MKFNEFASAADELSKLFNVESYLEINNTVPNKEIMELLDKFYKKHILRNLR